MSTTGLVHGCCSVRSRLVVQFDRGVIRSSVGVVIFGPLAYTLSSFDSADADRKGDQFTSIESPSSSMGSNRKGNVVCRDGGRLGPPHSFRARSGREVLAMKCRRNRDDFMLLFGQRLADQGDAKQLWADGGGRELRRERDGRPPPHIQWQVEISTPSGRRLAE